MFLLPTKANKIRMTKDDNNSNKIAGRLMQIKNQPGHASKRTHVFSSSMKRKQSDSYYFFWKRTVGKLIPICTCGQMIPNNSTDKRLMAR